MPTVRSLSFHATYRCQHSGACCTAGWPIPVERDRLGRLRLGLVNGTLRPAVAASDPALIFPADAPADTPAIVAHATGRCVFFGEAADGRCTIQATLGHEALPLACRQFPRVSVTDPRGVSVTLSHYCPTAASLLTDRSPVAIVTNAPAFPEAGEYVGLDATTGLPPLLRPGMLMDWESWWEFERLAVAWLSDPQHDPVEALRVLGAKVERLRGWSPAEGTLVERVRWVFAEITPASDRIEAAGPALIDEVMRAMPAAQRGVPGESPGATDVEAVRRFLVAHAFANWTAHLGQGLRTWLRSIQAAAALLEAGAGLRRADLLLRHLADTRALTDAWAAAERD